MVLNIEHVNVVANVVENGLEISMLSPMLWKNVENGIEHVNVVANGVERGLLLLLEMNLGNFHVPRCSLWPMVQLVEWMMVRVLDIVSCWSWDGCCGIFCVMLIATLPHAPLPLQHKPFYTAPYLVGVAKIKLYSTRATSS